MRHELLRAAVDVGARTVAAEGRIVGGVLPRLGHHEST